MEVAPGGKKKKIKVLTLHYAGKFEDMVKLRRKPLDVLFPMPDESEMPAPDEEYDDVMAPDAQRPEPTRALVPTRRRRSKEEPPAETKPAVTEGETREIVESENKDGVVSNTKANEEQVANEQFDKLGHTDSGQDTTQSQVKKPASRQRSAQVKKEPPASAPDTIAPGPYDDNKVYQAQISKMMKTTGWSADFLNGKAEEFFPGSGGFMFLASRDRLDFMNRMVELAAKLQKVAPVPREDLMKMTPKNIDQLLKMAAYHLGYSEHQAIKELGCSDRMGINDVVTAWQQLVATKFNV